MTLSFITMPPVPPNPIGEVLVWRNWFANAGNDINYLKGQVLPPLTGNPAQFLNGTGVFSIPSTGGALPTGFTYGSLLDWVTTVQPNAGAYLGHEYAYLSANAVLNLRPQGTGIGMLSASHSSSITGGGLLNYTSLMYNDNSTNAIPIWGMYITGARLPGVNGATQGIEIDVANISGSLAAIAPNNMFVNGLTANLWVAAGGETTGFPAHPGNTQTPVSVALAILSNDGVNSYPNQACYDKGIVFHNLSIHGTDGNSGSGIAIALATQQGLYWYNNSGNICGALTTSNTVGTGGLFLNINVAGFLVQDITSGGINFAVKQGNSYVNYPLVNGTTAGSHLVAFGANQTGGDTNIDVAIVPKGTGYFQFGGTTGSYNATSGITQAGYISIKDSSGTVRRLLIG